MMRRLPNYTNPLKVKKHLAMHKPAFTKEMDKPKDLHMYICLKIKVSSYHTRKIGFVENLSK
jgi:hypothetical protein